VRRFVCLLVTVILSSGSLNAQVQRLALAFGEYVARAGASVEIPAFCIDPHREAPPKDTVFHYAYGASGSTVISYKGTDYSPAEAAAAGIGEFVAGSDFNHPIFQPKVSDEVRIRVKSGTYLSELDEPVPVAKAKVIDGLLSNSKPKRVSIFDDDPQNRLWDRAEISDEQTILRDMGLYTGNIDGLDGPKLRHAENEFETKSGEDADLSTILDFAVQTKTNLSDDGKSILSDDVRARVGQVGFGGENGINRFRAYHDLAPGEITDPQFLEALRADKRAERLALFSFGSMYNQYLIENHGLEFWKIEKGVATVRVRGKAAIDAVDHESASAAEKASTLRETYIYPLTYEENASSISFQFGKEKVVESRTDVEAFLSGSGSLPKLEAALGGASSGGGGKPPIFIFRGTVGDDAPNPGGDPIPISTALASLGRRQINMSKFASEMRRKYGDRVEVFLASDSRIATKHAESITPVNGPSDLAVLQGEKIEDWGAIDDIVESLKKAKIPLINGDEENFEAGNVLILTGHRDRNLETYLQELAYEGKESIEEYLAEVVHKAPNTYVADQHTLRPLCPDRFEDTSGGTRSQRHSGVHGTAQDTGQGIPHNCK